MQEVGRMSKEGFGPWFEEKNSYVKEVIRDYWWCVVSREASVLSRKEVLTGKAKFGISGDGKELAQVALSKFFNKGDFRSGYYRDQTMAFVLGICTVEDYFSQLYADVENDCMSFGRQMSSHFSSDFLDENGEWLPLKDRYNFSSDISPTGGQMARGLGLALASKKFRELGSGFSGHQLSADGEEVVFCNIGDASTSEGVFFETVNAAAVLQVPLVVSVWDDGYGISVPRHLQTAKDSISRALEGFIKEQDTNGILIYTVKGWDYPSLCEVYAKATHKARTGHVPVLVHVQEITQPQGHSTSGSHERYKSPERLTWEQEMDCIKMMGQWMVDNDLVSSIELEEVKENAIAYARSAKSKAWQRYRQQADNLNTELTSLLQALAGTALAEAARDLQKSISQLINPMISEILQNARFFVIQNQSKYPDLVTPIQQWLSHKKHHYQARYSDNLYNEAKGSALAVQEVKATYSENSPVLNGYQILNTFFDQAFSTLPELLAFGEDVGKIGDVNQGFAGLQEKYGTERIFDTGIREWTIVGQAIGLAMRGFRPIAEIQYLDYLIYGLSPLSDDLATLRYRTRGRQKAPAIIRTRGHRLEGIWHSGSPIGMLLGSLRGMYLLVPRNMTQAAGMYNTLLHSDEPALVIECLNGYRLKEKLPDNLMEFTVPLGTPEILQSGDDISIVSYGSTLRIVEEAAHLLSTWGISAEVIDVQTLLPFDIHYKILESIKKTNRLLIVDEDVPGGASAYILREIIEVQGGYEFLDSKPVTLTAQAHRPPYGSDGDYFSKPNREDIMEAVLQIMHEADPRKYPLYL